MIKFLIVRFSSIGDIILTTPVVRCLKNQVEGAEIHYLTKRKFAQLVISNQYIDKVHLLDKSLNSLIKELKKENFDYVIDLHRNIRTFIVKFYLHRIAFSFHKLNVKKWLLVNFNWDLLPRQHIVDRYMSTLKIFDVINDGKGLDFVINPEEEIDIKKIFGRSLQHFIIIVVGGGHQTKQIPVEKIAELIENMNYDIVLIGGKEDIAKSESIMLKIKRKSVVNMTGKLNFIESASLIRQSDVIVTPDTGMMHIAAAFNKNIISVWGNTIPEFGMYPYKPGAGSKVFEIKGLRCRPCSKIGFSACPKKHFRCMQDQNMMDILKSINNILLTI